MSVNGDRFFAELERAVASDQITLPTLPEVALKIRDAVENENNSAEDIAAVIGEDPSIAARLIRVVNSPLFRPRTPIADLQMAVTRLGVQVVRHVVVRLTIKQMFRPPLTNWTHVSGKSGRRVSKWQPSDECVPCLRALIPTRRCLLV